MHQHPEALGLSPLMLLVRSPLQGVLILRAYTYTKRSRHGDRPEMRPRWHAACQRGRTRREDHEYRGSMSGQMASRRTAAPSPRAPGVLPEGSRPRDTLPRSVFGMEEDRDGAERAAR